MKGKRTPRSRKAPSSFAERLRQLMRMANLKPAALARDLGLSHVAVKNYLEGRVPETRALYQLSRHFGVSMEYLLNGVLTPDGKAEPWDEKTPPENLGPPPHILSRKSLVSEMNYEFRAPLNSVIGFSELLSKTPLTDEQKKHLQMITDSGDAILGKLNDILAATNNEAPPVNGGVSPVASSPAAPGAEFPDVTFNYRTLVVEDNVVTRRLLVKMLETFGICADQASSGRRGLERHVEEPYEVILMDVRMPGLDGLEMTRQVREAERAEPEREPAYIVAITAQVMPGDRERCLEAGMNGYLSKPVRCLDLMQVLLSRPERKKIG